MVVANTLRSLQFYDILANLVPGSVLLIVIVFCVRIESFLPEIPSSILVATFLILSFVTGHIVQTVASKLNGSPRLFGLVVAETREIEPYDPEGTLAFAPESIRAWLGFRRASLADVDISEIEDDFWPTAKDHFGLSDDFKNHGRLLQLILSHLEMTAATRALRFQSIHTFHRSMWAGGFISLLLVITLGASGFVGLLPTRSPITLVLIAVASVIGIRIFGNRKEKFNTNFVAYLLSDYHVERQNQNSI